MSEAALLWAALSLYGLASVGSVWSIRPGLAARTGADLPGLVLLGAIVLHTVALLLRWRELGHGPFTTLHEILSSNLWSLALVFAVASLFVREVRHALITAMPVWLVLGAWLPTADPGAGHLPPTYDTVLLYLHTLVGKLYLGLLLVALALGLLPLLRRARWLPGGLAGALREAPGDERLDLLAYRFAAFAFVFETLMLIVGAVWAQDAWGRYWAWDPLESWSFASWVALAGALHARATLRPTPVRFGLWLAGCFVLAFLTFFGVPFISTSPHKGAV